MRGQRVGIAATVATVAITAGVLVPSATGRGVGSDSFDPAVSANGRYVAFATGRGDLGGPLTASGTISNVYVYDRKRKKVQLVSRQSGGPGGDDDSHSPSISANGRYVAFTSDADNLGGPIETDIANVYVYDRKRKKVQLVSRQSRAAGGAGGDNDSYQPDISENGRYVAIRTEALNYGGPVSSVTNIYVYDRKRKRIGLVSRQSQGAGGAGGNGDSQDPGLSADGRIVSFSTYAENLGGPIDPGVKLVYVYDRKRKKTELVSRQSRSAGGDGAEVYSSSPGISANGRFVAFITDADNLGGPTEDVTNVYVYDRKRDKVSLVSRRSRSAGGAGADGNSDFAKVSANGRFVAFPTEADNLGGPAGDFSNVYVYDRKRKKIQLISRQSRSAGGDGASAQSDEPGISGSGRLVVFTTEAENLGGPFIAGFENVYAYDRKQKRVRLISRPSS